MRGLTLFWRGCNPDFASCQQGVGAVGRRSESRENAQRFDGAERSQTFGGVASGGTGRKSDDFLYRRERDLSSASDPEVAFFTFGWNRSCIYDFRTPQPPPGL